MGTIQPSHPVIDQPVVVEPDESAWRHSKPASDLHWLEVDLDRLRANVSSLRGLLAKPGSAVGSVSRRTVVPKLAAVVKADAYGLGMVPIARCLCDVGVDMLCVYSPQQASQLIAHGLACPILILMPAGGSLDEAVCAAIADGQVYLSVHHPDEVASVQQLGRSLGCPVPVHLYLDTGMRRGGLTADQFKAVLADGYDPQHVRIAGVYTHFTSADTDPQLTEHQYMLLEQAVEQNRKYIPTDAVIHVANTCGVLRDRRYHCGMVRVGLGLLGYGPAPGFSDDVVSGQLQPVARWVSRIVHVGRFDCGAGVGYGHTHRLTRDSYLGLIPAGYCDGYPLSLTNRSRVRVWSVCQGRYITAPVLGQVSMDQIIVDLTDESGGTSGVEVGGEVELISNDPASPCTLPRLAELAGSNCYELLCRLSHVPRRYKND